jgi:hypothetical protein
MAKKTQKDSDSVAQMENSHPFVPCIYDDGFLAISDFHHFMAPLPNHSPSESSLLAGTKLYFTQIASSKYFEAKIIFPQSSKRSGIERSTSTSSAL